MTNDRLTEKSGHKPVISTDMRRQLRHQRVQKIIQYFGLSSGGAGIAGITGLYFLGQPIAAFILPAVVTGVGTVLAIAYKFISNVTNLVWDKIEEELEGLEEPLANWIVAWLKNGVIALWWNINPKFQREYYLSLIDSFREFRLDGFRVGLPVLDLENVFVPLRVISASPEKISGAMIQTHSHSVSQDIWDFLSKSKKFQSYRRLAVVGAPGSGKTTLLKYLALIYAKKRHQDYGAPKFIPVLLYLRDIRDRLVTSQPPNLCELIESHIKSLPSHTDLTPPPNWIKDQLKIGNCLVMLDGLDEVADANQRQQVSLWVNRQMRAYPLTPFILTSRPDGYNSAPVDMVGTVLKVLPFTHEQMKDFIHSWYPQTEIMSRAGRDTPAVRAEAKKNADDLIDRIIDNRAIADMATNPLLVTMIATVHYNGSALPKGRVDLYQKICDVLLGARQAAKQNITMALTGVQNKAVLQVLALELMKSQTREFSLDQGEKLIADELVKVAGDKLTARAFLLQIKEICGLLMERELGVYEFAHLSFQEYLAASQIKESQDDTLLTSNLDDPWLAETIRLYAAQGDATKLIDAAIAKPTVKSLSLAFDCLHEAAKVESGTRQKLTDLLEAGLESDDPQIAKLAAEVSLLRRLDNLSKVNENLEIDLSYINCAEYRLFSSEVLYISQNQIFRNSKAPVTGIDVDTAIQFCNWLNAKAASLQSNSGSAHYYRLPTIEEIQTYPARESDLVSCAIGESTSPSQGLRIVKAKPPEFEVVTVNVKGQITNRQRSVAHYFNEPLDKNISLDMLFIPAGDFLMGAPESENESSDDERPQHEVNVKSFLMGKYSITQAQWRVVAAMPKVKIDLKLDPSQFKGDDRPVESVSWYEVMEFCARLSNHTGRAYRLPSEAEWEYACRAGTTTPFHFGETITPEFVNYNGDYPYGNAPKGLYRKETTPVGSFPANAFGLYDMHGNVWEWCADDWHDSYKGAPTDGIPWIDNSGRLVDDKNLKRSSNLFKMIQDMAKFTLSFIKYRGTDKSNAPKKALRGGSWYYIAINCRSASRNWGGADNCISDFGFRVVVA